MIRERLIYWLGGITYREHIAHCEAVKQICESGQQQLRPFTRWVARRLEETLERNDARGKGPWETEGITSLFCKFREEIAEVEDAIDNHGHPLVCAENRSPEAIEHFINECFDVVAATSMIASWGDAEVRDLRRGWVR
jgi:hypothetical protein